MASVTLPTHIDFIKWASQIREDLPNLQITNPPTTEKEWEKWAEGLFMGNFLPDVPIPKAMTFKTNEPWREWASFFIASNFLQNG